LVEQEEMPIFVKIAQTVKSQKRIIIQNKTSMHGFLQITNDVYFVGVNDRRKSLFENQLPLPHGVSYNAYLILDEKVALVDTVDIGFSDIFLKKIESLLGDRKLDYLIINHMEPDHSGSIRFIKERYPDIRIVGNKRTFEMINGYFGITTHLHEVKDGDELILGKHRLRFILTPMVHWPETMMTNDLTDKILFSGDAFGCFGSLNGGVIDQTMNTDNYWEEMRRYYACIIGKYGSPVQSALAKLQEVELNYICSTHGPVWHEQIEKAKDIYAKCSKYETIPGVVIAYGSMYGNTEQMAEVIAEGVVSAGLKDVILYDVSHTDASFILSDVFKYTGLIIGSPTYMNDLLPGVDSLLRKIEARGVKNRVFAAFGSFTWAGVAPKKIVSLIESLHWDIVGTVEEKQALKQEKQDACFSLGKEVALKILSTK
jgi:flavorubredoxin